jgi:polysaccharide chain length determinant protein (PEP-CTERM system associated)
VDSIKNLLFYLKLIWRSKWIVIIPTVLFTVIGALLALKLPSYYKSETLIMIEKQQIPEAYVTPTDRTPFSQRLNTISQQILSRQNIEKIVNDFQLYKDQDGANPVSAFIGYFRPARPASTEEVIERMTKDVDIRVIGGRSGDAFSVSYIGTNPEVTMQVTNTLASLFIDENLKSREQYAEGASDFIMTELENAKKELEAQEQSLRNFKERNMGSLPQQLDANLRTLDRLQSELQLVKNDLKSAEDRKMVIEAQLGRGTVSVPGMPANPLQTELENLQRELTALLARYRENYPDVIIAKKKIAEIKEQLASNRQAASATGSRQQDTSLEQMNPEVYNELMLLNSRIGTLSARASEIRKHISQFEKRVETTPASEQRFIDLRRDYDISLANYQTLLEKKMNAKLAENLEKRQKGERFKVINSANLPEKPFRPNKPAIVAAGATAGLGLGIGVILFMEFMNPSFRTKDELAGFIDMPVLATVPAFASSKPEKRKKTTFRVFKRNNGHT